MNIQTSYPAGFNYDFRPVSYFRDLSPETLVLTSILGEERRKDVQRRLASDGLDPELQGEWLTEGKLDDFTRQQLGRMHPSMMGGEYLPSVGQQEIEIARIVLASTTQDVISIRARRTRRFIAYRVVDEYETEYELARQRTAKPLTLRELIEFINRTDRPGERQEDRNGLVFSVLEMNLRYEDDPESMRDFVSIESSFYPELGSYFDCVINDYLDEMIKPEEELENEEAAPDAFPATRQLYDLQNLPEDPALGAMRESERSSDAQADKHMSGTSRKRGL